MSKLGELERWKQDRVWLWWKVGTHSSVPYESHVGAWLGFLAYYVRFPEQPVVGHRAAESTYGIPHVDPVLIADFYLAKE